MCVHVHVHTAAVGFVNRLQMLRFCVRQLICFPLSTLSLFSSLFHFLHHLSPFPSPSPSLSPSPPSPSPSPFLPLFHTISLTDQLTPLFRLPIPHLPPPLTLPTTHPPLSHALISDEDPSPKRTPPSLPSLHRLTSNLNRKRNRQRKVVTLISLTWRMRGRMTPGRHHLRRSLTQPVGTHHLTQQTLPHSSLQRGR